MAIGCRILMGMELAVLVVMSCTILLMWGAHAAVHDQHLSRLHFDSSCPPPFTYVYPVNSHCSQPARFFTEEFRLYNAASENGLEPEWDEANSTYYMRLTASTSASYTVLYNLSAAGGIQVENVYQNFPALLQNTESKRYLAWREEGVDEHFLIETNTFDDASTFWFFQDLASQLPCAKREGARCEAYNLMSFPNDRRQAVAGWLLYEESGVNYIKLATPQSRGQVPIILARITSTIGATFASSSLIRTTTT